MTLKHAEHVWDTVVSLHLRDGDGEAARDAVVAWLHQVDDELSTFKDTPLTRWRASELDLFDAPPSVREVVALARACSARTGGAFDAHWAGGAVDPTGVVKGWAVDRAVALLQAYEVTEAQVNAGGDVRALGGPWRIGVTDPRAGGILTVVEGSDFSVATSGVAERGAHVLRGGRPASGLLQVSVMGADLARTDAWATALLALGGGSDELAADLDADGWPSLRVTDDGSLLLSAGWP